MAAQSPYNSSPGFGEDGKGIHMGNDVWFLPAIATTPTNGTSGTGVGFAGPGSLVISSSTKQVYMNVNTAASPTWVLQAS